MTKENRTPFVVAFACFLLIFIVASSAKTIVLLMPVYESKGISMSIMGTVIVLTSVATFFSSMLAPKLIDKMGLKATMLLGVGLTVACFVLLPAVKNVTGLLMAYCMIGFGSNLCGYVPASITLNRWFVKKKSTVIAAVFTGMSFGTAFYSLIVGRILEAHGFTATCLTIAAIIGVLAPVVITIFVKDDPHHYNLTAYGLDDLEEGEKEAQGNSLSLEPKEAFGSTLFISILAVTLLGSGVISSVQSFMPAFWQSVGYSTSQAGTFFSLMSFVSAFATIMGGYLADRFSARFFVVYSTVFFIAATALLLLASGHMPSMYMAGVIMGLAYPLCSITPSVMLGETYDNDSYSKLIGSLQGLTFLSIAAILPLVGHLYDRYGNYRMAFSIMIVAAHVIFIFVGIYSYQKKKALQTVVLTRKEGPMQISKQKSAAR